MISFISWSSLYIYGTYFNNYKLIKLLINVQGLVVPIKTQISCIFNSLFLLFTRLCTCFIVSIYILVYFRMEEKVGQEYVFIFNLFLQLVIILWNVRT